MVATAKKRQKTKAKYTLVAVRPEAMDLLREVSKARGWTYGEAVNRMSARELELVRTEASLHR